MEDQPGNPLGNHEEEYNVETEKTSEMPRGRVHRVAVPEKQAPSQDK